MDQYSSSSGIVKKIQEGYGFIAQYVLLHSFVAYSEHVLHAETIIQGTRFVLYWLFQILLRLTCDDSDISVRLFTSKDVS